ncbi:hypothetical protein BRADI_4g10415v3 [Brachypodium distachyon]|uniref:Uncharacterized protein n=1 Tax=Brachypodium distachyon TaxID=15368 RepID=A0A2K2CLT8_BRADI|nr:hypothetical protein BRADI_4g10415v3 [Brachypodium distachyon]
MARASQAPGGKPPPWWSLLNVPDEQDARCLDIITYQVLALKDDCYEV